MSTSPGANVAEQRSSETTTGMEAVKEAIQGEENEEEQVERSEEAEKENKEDEDGEGDAGCDDDYNRLFAHRFTAEDKDFQEFLSRPAELPPVVWNWRSRGGRNDRRSRGRWSRRFWLLPPPVRPRFFPRASECCAHVPNCASEDFQPSRERRCRGNSSPG
ncbi:unnamed protein product [Lampetra fluviatilis]